MRSGYPSRWTTPRFLVKRPIKRVNEYFVHIYHPNLELKAEAIVGTYRFPSNKPAG